MITECFSAIDHVPKFYSHFNDLISNKINDFEEKYLDYIKKLIQNKEDSSIKRGIIENEISRIKNKIQFFEKKVIEYKKLIDLVK